MAVTLWQLLHHRRLMMLLANSVPLRRWIVHQTASNLLIGCQMYLVDWWYLRFLKIHSVSFSLFKMSYAKGVIVGTMSPMWDMLRKLKTSASSMRWPRFDSWQDMELWVNWFSGLAGINEYNRKTNTNLFLSHRLFCTTLKNSTWLPRCSQGLGTQQ